MESVGLSIACVCLTIVLALFKFLIVEIAEGLKPEGGTPMSKHTVNKVQISVLELYFGLGTNILAAALLA